MDHRYKEALEGLARLSDAASPGQWDWFGDQTSAVSQENFVTWAERLYQRTITLKGNTGVMHIIGTDTDLGKDVVAVTGFSPQAAANARFLLAAAMYVRGIIEIARERGDIDATVPKSEPESTDG